MESQDDARKVAGSAIATDIFRRLNNDFSSKIRLTSDGYYNIIACFCQLLSKWILIGIIEEIDVYRIVLIA